MFDQTIPEILIDCSFGYTFWASSLVNQSLYGLETSQPVRIPERFRRIRFKSGKNWEQTTKMELIAPSRLESYAGCYDALTLNRLFVSSRDLSKPFLLRTTQLVFEESAKMVFPARYWKAIQLTHGSVRSCSKTMYSNYRVCQTGVYSSGYCLHASRYFKKLDPEIQGIVLFQWLQKYGNWYSRYKWGQNAGQVLLGSETYDWPWTV